jgi:hypothetical protein
MSKYNKQNTHPIKEVITEYLKKFKIDEKFLEMESVRLWDELLGNAIASKTGLIRFESGKMIVRIESSIVREELLRARNNIKEKINKELQTDFVKEIVLR